MAIIIRIFAILLMTAHVLSEEKVFEEEDDCLDETGLFTVPPPTECPYVEEAYNVALEKVTHQSSVWQGHDSHAAVDGNTTPDFYPANTCTHTNDYEGSEDNRPWLIVDLGKRHVVHYVKLYSRNDSCCNERYHDLVVQVGDQFDSGVGVVFDINPVCDQIKGGDLPPAHVFQFNCSKSCMIGQYVSVQITEDGEKPNVLVICELEVYGYPVD